MAMGRKGSSDDKKRFGIARTELARTVAHQFNEQLNRLRRWGGPAWRGGTAFEIMLVEVFTVFAAA